MEATAEISAGIHSYSVGRTVVGSVTPATEVGAVFDDDRSASISGSGIAAAEGKEEIVRITGIIENGSETRIIAAQRGIPTRDPLDTCG
jgi:hypothetical protein